MQKKVIKRKQTPKRTNKSSNTTKEYNIRKKQQAPKNKNNNQNILIACWIGFVALLLLCYLKLGLTFTIITAVGIGIIVGVSQLLRKTKNDNSCKRASFIGRKISQQL